MYSDSVILPPGRRFNWIGRPVRRLEDRALLAGDAKTVADITLPGLQELVFVRSPHPHANIVAIHVPPGKSGQVIQAEDLAWVKPLDPRITFEGYANMPIDIMPDRARYVGDLVGAVIAENRYAAEDLAESVVVEYDPLPAVLSPEDREAYDLYPELPGNIVFERHFTSGSPDKVIAEAPHVFRETFRRGRVQGAPIECRGVVANFDRATGTLHVWSATQMPHEFRTALANTLGLPERKIRVIAPNVGGGFGVKSRVYREEIIVAALAYSRRVPLRWIEDRREHLMSSSHTREATIEVEWAAAEDGRLLAARAHVSYDVGAHQLYPVGLIIEPLGVADHIPGPYKLAGFEYRVEAVLTNKCPIGTYRGVYMPSAAFVRERMMDITAKALNIDPLEIRRRNVFKQADYPCETVTGIRYEALSLEQSLSELAAASNYEQLRQVVDASRRGPVLKGLGLAVFTEVTGTGSKGFHRRGMMTIPGYDCAEATIFPDGTIQIAVSGSAHGQGHRTTLAQLAAEIFGVSPADIEIVQSDTALAPYGTGTRASRGAVAVGGAVLRACYGLRAKLIHKAGELLEAAPEDIIFADGAVKVVGTSQCIPLPMLASYIYGVHAAGTPQSAGECGFKESALYDPPGYTIANGAHLAMVEIDVETLQIKVVGYWVVGDCGRIINPLIVDGQTQGGIAQGLGEALLEEVRYDANGQFTTATLMDFLMPTAADMPAELVIQHLETPAPGTIGGFKGAGESGTIGAVAAVANAVEDAISGWGVAINETPLTESKLARIVLHRDQDT